MKQKIEVKYDYIESDENLSSKDLALVEAARNATAKSYSPYSHFKVGAAILMKNGAIITGANQENASYPATICAERIALGGVIANYPNEAIDAIAISYQKAAGKSLAPISPCGVCRQALSEFENRQDGPIRVLLSGFEKESPTIITDDVASLLPFVFSDKNMD